MSPICIFELLIIIFSSYKLQNKNRNLPEYFFSPFALFNYLISQGKKNLNQQKIKRIV